MEIVQLEKDEPENSKVCQDCANFTALVVEKLGSCMKFGSRGAILVDSDSSSCSWFDTKKDNC